MKFYLIVAKGKHQGLPIPIEIDLFLIGSDKMCQLRSQADGMGMQHCAFVTRERKVFIRDLGSGEFTYVNDAPMPEHSEWPLHAGDHIRVGPLEFMIQFREKPLSQRDLEEWALRCLDESSGKRDRHVIDELEMQANTRSRSLDAAQAAAAILDKLNAQRGIVRGRLRIAREGNVTIVRINDIYLVEEAELALINKELHDNLNHPNLRVLLDFKNVRRMSSTAAEMFAEIADWLMRQGSSLAICRLRPELRAALQTLHLTDTVPTFTDKSSALMGAW
ncbi:MAG TPA: FHA domain-containing protein [Gemmataceae bacterium]|jgi:anti-anti-sigma regulatory factor|nr:FHA domain-containing protein [Gemmataceae bacterium]